MQAVSGAAGVRRDHRVIFVRRRSQHGKFDGNAAYSSGTAPTPFFLWCKEFDRIHCNKRRKPQSTPRRPKVGAAADENYLVVSSHTGCSWDGLHTRLIAIWRLDRPSLPGNYKPNLLRLGDLGDHNNFSYWVLIFFKWTHYCTTPPATISWMQKINLNKESAWYLVIHVGELLKVANAAWLYMYQLTQSSIHYSSAFSSIDTSIDRTSERD